jgi:hypothetical protein
VPSSFAYIPWLCDRVSRGGTNVHADAFMLLGKLANGVSTSPLLLLLLLDEEEQADERASSCISQIVACEPTRTGSCWPDVAAENGGEEVARIPGSARATESSRSGKDVDWICTGWMCTERGNRLCAEADGYATSDGFIHASAAMDSISTCALAPRG